MRLNVPNRIASASRATARRFDPPPGAARGAMAEEALTLPFGGKIDMKRGQTSGGCVGARERSVSERPNNATSARLSYQMSALGVICLIADDASRVGFVGCAGRHLELSEA